MLQKEIRKLGNKVYPVRFSEIERIEVVKPGQSDESPLKSGSDKVLGE